MQALDCSWSYRHKETLSWQSSTIHWQNLAFWTLLCTGRHIYCAWMNFNDYFIRYSSYMAALTNTTDPEQSWRVEQVSNSIYWNFVLHCNSILYNPDFCWNSRNIIRDQRNEVSAKQNLISVDHCWISGPSIVSHWKLTMRKTLQNSIWSQANSNPKVVLWIVVNSLSSDIKQL